jgi:uncharacterized protein YeaO (DUF488 family)
MSSIAVERIFGRAAPRDGSRILLDRLWPHGFSKDTAALDLWSKDVAPSAETRTLFEHREDSSAEFEKRYLLKLRSIPADPRWPDRQAQGNAPLRWGRRRQQSRRRARRIP